MEELIESGNSNTFVLNNAKANTLSNLKIYGNTSQTQYSGNNLYNVNDYCTYKSNCITNESSADEDGWITLSYDNTNGSSVRYSNYFVNNLDLVVGDDLVVFSSNTKLGVKEVVKKIEDLVSESEETI